MTIETKHKLEPAYSVVERLGGKTVVSDRLKLNKSTLSRWCQRVPYGTGGVIPYRHWPTLLQMAREGGVELTVEALIPAEA